MQIIYILIVLLLAVSCRSYSQDEFPVLEGPYMGQQPPGMLAEPFAPGIISKTGWELEGVFAPDMKEFYFTLDRGKIVSPTETVSVPPLLASARKITYGSSILNSHAVAK